MKQMFVVRHGGPEKLQLRESPRTKPSRGRDPDSRKSQRRQLCRHPSAPGSISRLAQGSNGKGVALITDPLGGNHWKKSYKALRSTGRLGMFGVSVATTSKLFGPLRLLPVALGMPLFHPLALMNTNKSAFGVNLGTCGTRPT